MNVFVNRFLLCLFLVVGSVSYGGPNQSAPKQESELAPCVIVIFGSSGDLASRKLLPAIYNLAREGDLSKKFAVVGFSHRDQTNEVFHVQMREAISKFSRNKPIDSAFLDKFENKLFYNQASFEQDEGYEKLEKLLSQIDKDLGTEGNRIYYLATHSSYFPVIIEKLHRHHLIYEPTSGKNQKWSKVVIEKPFGHDLESAILLQKNISKYLDSSQIYRIDHYLGKEGVQNLFTLRFENVLFEPIWNNRYIDNIQITLSEDIGIGTRARLWEETGLLRDIFQNHMMQLLSIIAMEPPQSLSAENIHAEKVKVLDAIRPFPLKELDQYVVRGQYGPGEIHGAPVLGYREEKGVSKTSQIETFVAAKMFIDNDRWKGVPFYIRGGKRLPTQTTEIVVTFKKKNSLAKAPNALFIRIQPKTGVFVKILSKVPGIDAGVKPAIFGYELDEYFGKSSPEAYEELIYDCIKGDHSLFVSKEEQLAAWRLLTPVIDYWKMHPPKDFPNYSAGTWGPVSADQMIQESGREWLLYK